MTRIKVGDEVVVISGKDTGKRGKVVKKLPKEDRIMIEGINMVKRHVRPTRRGQVSGIVEGEAPMHASKVALICSRCGKRTRIGMKTLREEGQLRFCKKCGEVID
ncbi:50S ribosomal protein L24 [Candidatus Aerophobetes bacterium]|uniref:Large ribosomal subunit protein uL24 n=1 Tax=Aerophobetes bacterium TaxID=2030807 RepID=A0A523UYY5_UNCAE|nr:MAG: 50S ribosomal protein L24 [Candidatus Aerophobetes bacterium]